MPEEIGGVRDHLANERTQLAWLRSGANIIVVGLAVARFANDGDVSLHSLLAGAVLVVAGVAAVVMGTVRYRRVAAELRQGTAHAAADTFGPTVAAIGLLVCVAIAGLLLMLT